MDGLEGGERLKGRGREHAGLEVDQGGQGAHHTAETVVQRVRDADDRGTVGVARAEAHEEGVVEDVVVGQRGTLGLARGPARVLDVAGICEGTFCVLQCVPISSWP